jgi:hypothetical protein
LTRDELVMSLANRLYILSRLLTARVDGWGPEGELVKALVAELVEQVREGIIHASGVQGISESEVSGGR